MSDAADAAHGQRECIELVLCEIMTETEILTWWHVPLGELEGLTPWACLESGFYELVTRLAFGYLRELCTDEEDAA